MGAVRGLRVSAEPWSAAADQPVIIGAGPAPMTRRALESDVLRLRDRVPRGATAALVACGSGLVAAALVALEGWAARVELVGDLDPATASADAVVLRGGEFEAGFEGLAGPPGAGSGSCAGDEMERTRTAWRLFSSGTTGSPTPTDHSFLSLTRLTRPAGQQSGHRRWGLLYPPTRMAGVQVILQAIHGGDSLVDAHDTADLDERLARFARSGVDAMSATPTMWRMVLRSRAYQDLALRQITLGGEIAAQSLLDALARRFAARLTHIYASTEAGAAFSVKDGRAGFPLRYLETGADGIGLEIRDGVLFVRAPGSSVAGPDGFVRTGDLVEVRGDRVHFLGRMSGVVNVGGDNVVPERVEELLRGHPAVADARVVPRRSPITGWILTSEIVPVSAGDLDPRELQSALRAFVARHLPRSHVPARVDVVSRLPLSSTGKADRT